VVKTAVEGLSENSNFVPSLVCTKNLSIRKLGSLSFPFMCLVLPQGGQDQGRREGQCEVSQTDLMSKYLKTKVNKMDFHFIMRSNCSHFWWLLQFRFVLISAACFSNHHGKIQSGSRAEFVSIPMREWCESATFRKSLLLRLHTSRVDRPTGSSQRT